MLSDLTVVEGRHHVDLRFGGQAVAQVLHALADVRGQGVPTLDTFVSLQAAAGHQAHHVRIGVPLIPAGLPVGAHAGRP